MKIASEAFRDGDSIPRRYTGDGEDVSPPLAWEGVPAETKELALVCDDPDAPTPQPWVHWVLYEIPADVSRLPEGLPRRAVLASPIAALQGCNSWPKGATVGYRGPAPPPGHGTHHYRFRLYALDAPLTAPAGLDKAALLELIEGHVLAEAEMVGTYRR